MKRCPTHDGHPDLEPLEAMTPLNVALCLCSGLDTECRFYVGINVLGTEGSAQKGYRNL